MSELINDAASDAVAVRIVMDQLPDSSVTGQSPLYHADLATLAEQGAKTGGVIFKENAFTDLLNLRCNSADSAQVAAVESLLGLSLPTSPLTVNANEQRAIRWLSPDEWLISAPCGQAFELESAFADSMPGHYSLVNVSGGMTVIDLSGPHVVDVLKKSVPVDLHLTQFPVGKVVSTVFAKSGAIVRRLDTDRFELVIRRSFADYLWLWIQDASREYGIVVQA